MPNKYKLTAIVIDDFESVEEEPLSESSLEEEIINDDLSFGVTVSDVKFEKIVEEGKNKDEQQSDSTGTSAV